MASSDDDSTARPDPEARREEREPDRREQRDRREEREPDRREHREPDRREHRDRDGDSLSEMLRQRLEQLVPDLVKKTFAAGMGAVFQTEEGIRRLARESLPEVAGYIASSADGAKDRVSDAKDRVFDVIARETREFLSNLNVGEEIVKILTTLSFEIKTEIRFIPNSERITGAEPEVKASVRLKRNDRDVKDRDAKDRDAKDRDAKDRDAKDRDVKDRDAKDRDAKDDDDDGGRRSRLRFWQRDRDPSRDGGGGGGSGGVDRDDRGDRGDRDRDQDDSDLEK